MHETIHEAQSGRENEKFNNIESFHNTYIQDQFKYLGSTQTKDGTSIKEVKIILVQAHSAMTRLAILWKTMPSVFLQRYNSLALSILF